MREAGIEARERMLLSPRSPLEFPRLLAQLAGIVYLVPARLYFAPLVLRGQPQSHLRLIRSSARFVSEATAAVQVPPGCWQALGPAEIL